MTTSKDVLDKTQQFVKQRMEGEGSGHDWWHIVRVVNTAKTIAVKEGGDLFVIELAALLHDIADWKFHGGDTTVGSQVTREWLLTLDTSNNVIDQVAYIVKYISFKGGSNTHKMKTIEGKVVQDADRLDALGAIGIARAFAYGGAAGREMYSPSITPRRGQAIEHFKQTTGNHTINHFYEKLLLLKDRMNTKTAKEMAGTRHDYMQKYLDEFYAEWEGKK